MNTVIRVIKYEGTEEQLRQVLAKSKSEGRHEYPGQAVMTIATYSSDLPLPATLHTSQVLEVLDDAGAKPPIESPDLDMEIVVPTMAGTYVRVDRVSRTGNYRCRMVNPRSCGVAYLAKDCGIVYAPDQALVVCGADDAYKLFRIAATTCGVGSWEFDMAVAVD